MVCSNAAGAPIMHRILFTTLHTLYHAMWCGQMRSRGALIDMFASFFPPMHKYFSARTTKQVQNQHLPTLSLNLA